MKVSYQLAEDDYYHVRRAISPALDRGLLLKVATCLVLCAGAVLAEDTRVRNACLLFGLALCAHSMVLNWLNERAGARTDTTGKQFDFEISAWGLRPLGEPSTTPWRHFSSYSVAKYAFVLYREQSVEAILPKRAFTGDELKAISEILRANLPLRRG